MEIKEYFSKKRKYFYKKVKNRWIAKKNFCKLKRETRSGDRIMVIGDSHVNYFSGNEELTYLPIGKGIDYCPQVTGYNFTALHIGAATAFNCMKKNSRVNTYNKIMFCVKSLCSRGGIILSLGEIDCRVHVLKNAALKQDSYKNVIDEIIIEYEKLIVLLKRRGYKVCVWGPIATQSDEVKIDDRYPRYGTCAERNKVTEYFNERLRDICKLNNIAFMSIFDKLIDSHYKTIRYYYSGDGVHLGQKANVLTDSLFDEYFRKGKL